MINLHSTEAHQRLEAALKLPHAAESTDFALSLIADAAKNAPLDRFSKHGLMHRAADFLETSSALSVAYFAYEAAVANAAVVQAALKATPPKPERAVTIENFTNGIVTRQDMFPNTWHKVWPELVRNITTTTS